MADIIVLYGEPKDRAAFDDYYFNTHMALARKVPGVREIRISKGDVTVLGSERSCYLVARLTFDSAEAMQAALASPEGQATAADVPNYATGGAEILLFDTAAP